MHACVCGGVCVCMFGRGEREGERYQITKMLILNLANLSESKLLIKNELD